MSFATLFSKLSLINLKLKLNSSKCFFKLLSLNCSAVKQLYIDNIEIFCSNSRTLNTLNSELSVEEMCTIYGCNYSSFSFYFLVLKTGMINSLEEIYIKDQLWDTVSGLFKLISKWKFKNQKPNSIKIFNENTECKSVVELNEYNFIELDKSRNVWKFESNQSKDNKDLTNSEKLKAKELIHQEIKLMKLISVNKMHLLNLNYKFEDIDDSNIKEEIKDSKSCNDSFENFNKINSKSLLPIQLFDFIDKKCANIMFSYYLGIPINFFVLIYSKESEINNLDEALVYSKSIERLRHTHYIPPLNIDLVAGTETNLETYQNYQHIESIDNYLCLAISNLENICVICCDVINSTFSLPALFDMLWPNISLRFVNFCCCDKSFLFQLYREIFSRSEFKEKYRFKTISFVSGHIASNGRTKDCKVHEFIKHKSQILKFFKNSYQVFGTRSIEEIDRYQCDESIEDYNKIKIESSFKLYNPTFSTTLRKSIKQYLNDFPEDSELDKFIQGLNKDNHDLSAIMNKIVENQRIEDSGAVLEISANFIPDITEMNRLYLSQNLSFECRLFNTGNINMSIIFHNILISDQKYKNLFRDTLGSENIKLIYDDENLFFMLIDASAKCYITDCIHLMDKFEGINNDSYWISEIRPYGVINGCEFINPFTLLKVLEWSENCEVLQLNCDKLYLDISNNIFESFNFSNTKTKILILNVNSIYSFNKFDITSNIGSFNMEQEVQFEEIKCYTAFSLAKFLVNSHFDKYLEKVFISTSLCINFEYFRECLNNLFSSKIKFSIEAYDFSVYNKQDKSFSRSVSEDAKDKEFKIDNNTKNLFNSHLSKKDSSLVQNLAIYSSQVNSKSEFNQSSEIYNQIPGVLNDLDSEAKIKESLSFKEFKFYKEKIQIELLQYNNLKVLYEKFGKYEYHFCVRLDPTELVSVGITQAGAYFILIEYKSAEPNDNTAYGIYVSHKEIYEGETRSKEGLTIGRLITSMGHLLNGTFSTEVSLQPGRIHSSGFQEYSVKHSITGYGNCLYPNGDIIEGKYDDGVPHGNCTYIMTNNTKVEGLWVNGARDGIHIFTDTDGSTEVLNYRNCTRIRDENDN